MPRDSFPAGVAEQLKWYVYWLIDPRNGETFYVGKGSGNRIFAHARGDYAETVSLDTAALNDEDIEDSADLKIKRINEIKSVGLDVGHVVHRHGIETEDVAYQVEAALIDAYPGLTNQAGGHGSGDYGSRHVEEIIAQYAAEPFEVKESLILIYIGRTINLHDDPYNAVRCAWKINGNKANSYKLVLAHANGKVVGAYRPTAQWIPATQKDFPGLIGEDFINPATGNPTRWGFAGDRAEDVWNQYVGKRVPDEYKGAQNPVRYCDKSA